MSRETPPKLPLSNGGNRAPIKYVVPLAHPSPYPKRHQISCFSTAVVVTNRYTDRQTDGRTDRQTERQTATQTDHAMTVARGHICAPHEHNTAYKL